MDNPTLQKVALFDKCSSFTTARDFQKADLYPYFSPITDSNETVVTIRGEQKIMMGSNNYLGLTHDPAVLEASKEALFRLGSGCTGSRFLNGTLDLHEELEERLSKFIGKESTLVYATGYQANVGVISGLMGRGEIVFLDKLDHASIVDGAMMSAGTVERFQHGNLDQLDLRMGRHEGKGMLVVVDGVYSMEGDIADVPGLLKLTKKYGAALLLDDAHSIGVLGPRGNGTAAHFGLTDEVDIISGTFSKSLGSIGGFVSASEEVIHWLKHKSRPMIFSAALPPANTAGVLAALNILENDDERRNRLWANTARLQEGFRELGFDIGPTETPIVPVLIGPVEDTLKFWKAIYNGGVFTNPVIPPAVPPAESRLRTSLMSTHTHDQIDFTIEIFSKVGKEMGII